MQLKGSDDTVIEVSEYFEATDKPLISHLLNSQKINTTGKILQTDFSVRFATSIWSGSPLSQGYTQKNHQHYDSIKYCLHLSNKGISYFITFKLKHSKSYQKVLIAADVQNISYCVLLCSEPHGREGL